MTTPKKIVIINFKFRIIIKILVEVKTQRIYQKKNISRVFRNFYLPLIRTKVNQKLPNNNSKATLKFK